MPLYEYNCHLCGRNFEVRQHFADEPLKIHEGCGGEVERLISVPTLQFKGTGFYVTDYGRNGKLPAKSGSNGHSDSKTETKTGSKTENKAETKTETKTEATPAPAKT